MAYFYRLIIGAIAWFMASAAWSAVPTVSVYEYRGSTYSTASAACAAYIAYVQPSNPGVTMSVASIQEFPTSAVCKINSSLAGDSWVDSVTISKSGGRCPDNSTLTGSDSCTCDKGFVEVNGQCKYESTGNSCNGLGDFCSGLKGQKINLEGKGTATPPGCAADSARPNCPMGCAGEAVGMGVSYKTADGSWMTGQEYRVTGGTCTLPQPSEVPQC